MTGSPPDSLPEDLGSSQSERPARVLYPYRETDADIIFEVALAVAEAHDGELFLVDVDTGGEKGVTSTSDGLARKLLELHVDREVDTPIKRHTVTGKKRTRAIATAVEAFGVDAVVVSEREGSDRIRRRVDCDVVGVDSTRIRSIGSILAPIAGGPHTSGIVDVAGALATASDAWVEFLHVRTGDEFPDERGERILAAAKERLPDVETDGRILDGDDAAEAIAAETEYYDVTVIGAPRKGRVARFVLGSTTTDIRGQAENTVVTVRRGTSRTLFPDPPT